MTTESWLTLASGVLGGGGLATLTNFLLAKATTNNAAKLAGAAQPIDQYSHIVEQLRKQIDADRAENKSDKQRLEAVVEKLGEKLEKCNDHHLKCEREMAAIRGEVGAYRKLLEARLLPPPSPSGESVNISGNPPIDSFTVEDTDNFKLQKSGESNG